MHVQASDNVDYVLHLLIMHNIFGFSCAGDIMGPALNNLDGLVRMPTGCGEQNMVGFTPNIYVLKYLNASSRLTNQIQDKAKFYMETGKSV